MHSTGYAAAASSTEEIIGKIHYNTSQCGSDQGRHESSRWIADFCLFSRVVNGHATAAVQQSFKPDNQYTSNSHGATSITTTAPAV